MCCFHLYIIVDVVQLLSHVQLFVTPWTAAHQASLPFTISWSLLKFMSIESVMPSHHLILCCPLLLLPSIFPSIRVFFNESALHIRRHTQVQMLKVSSLWLPFFPTSFPMGVVPHQSPWRIYSLWGNMPRSIYLQPGQCSALASGKNGKSPLKTPVFPRGFTLKMVESYSCLWRKKESGVFSLKNLFS